MTATWKWPNDYKLLTSKDSQKDFIGMDCATIRGDNIIQTAKFFCWKHSSVPQPLVLVDKPLTNRSCITIGEPGDLTYLAKHLCLRDESKEEIPLIYSYFSPLDCDSNCLHFNLWKIKVDAWFDNVIKAKRPNVKFVGKHCPSTGKGK